MESYRATQSKTEIWGGQGMIKLFKYFLKGGNRIN